MYLHLHVHSSYTGKYWFDRRDTVSHYLNERLLNIVHESCLLLKNLTKKNYMFNYYIIRDAIFYC